MCNVQKRHTHWAQENELAFDVTLDIQVCTEYRTEVSHNSAKVVAQPQPSIARSLEILGTLGESASS